MEARKIRVGSALRKTTNAKPECTGVEGLAGLERKMIDSKTIVFVNPNKGQIVKKRRRR